jgi:hypothetical protein
MKFEFRIMWMVVFLALGAGAAATTYYVNDDSVVGDVYCSQRGNDANDGRTPATPKLTLTNLLAATSFLPGDVVLIDTGIYPVVTNSVTLGTNVAGTAGAPILFQGSTNLIQGGTVFTGYTASAVFELRGSYIHFRNLQTWGGGNGFLLTGARNCELEKLQMLYAGQALRLVSGASSNSFRRCVMHAVQYSASGGDAPGSGNYMENCVAWSMSSAAFAAQMGLYSNCVNNIGVGVYAMGAQGYGIDIGSRNILSYSRFFSVPYETLADYCRVYTNFQNNTVADPKFVNADGFDFHLLSASGFVSNGVWVTNATVGFSPGIDFGARE